MPRGRQKPVAPGGAVMPVSPGGHVQMPGPGLAHTIPGGRCCGSSGLHPRGSVVTVLDPTEGGGVVNLLGANDGGDAGLAVATVRPHAPRASIEIAATSSLRTGWTLVRARAGA